MKEQNTTAPNRLVLLYLSWFGVGYAPKAPGTFGSLATLPLLRWLHTLELSTLTLSLLALIMTILGCWGADVVQRQLSLQDPQWIVIDEVIGMLITWTIVRPLTLWGWIFVFAAFRFVDIVKIWPASYFDKKVKNGAGTILDDVVSAFYAGVFVYCCSVFIQRF